ncbi:MAG TPA: DinB family protein [Cytophagaceae bacterium]|jgi:uncharacterized damage-inducible protein DinB|nr:DinB family protein [Cytophagaceae bacterium]
MATVDVLLSELDHNTNQLTEILLDFDTTSFTKRPDENSWSAAEVAEHIYVLDKVIHGILSGETASSDRPSDEKVVLIKSVMSNRSRTLVAPDPIVPLGKVKEQQLIIPKIIRSRKELYTLIQSAELSLLCKSFEHKGFGPMTRLEWVVFLIAHTQRHFGQFASLSEHFNNLR